MAQVTVGQQAPDFALPSSTGETVKLADLLGTRAVVLYFYPRDLTPGCTQEACSFRDLRSEFEAASATILGISTDDLASHAKFSAKHELRFPLHADVDASVATAYGVYREKNLYGRKSLGVVRSTLVIDKAGQIVKIYPRVDVKKHAGEVLQFVRTLV